MQFNFNVNDILRNSIEIIDNKSNLDYYYHNVDAKSVKNLQNSQKLSYIIDEMGKASKLAQNLPVVITTGSKLKNSDHRLYISKNSSSNNNDGEVVGLLKVGYKKLFLYDIMGNHFETTPMCILDFYIHETKQRQGYGKQIFEFMLKNENLKPYNLAIDRPSTKFLSFLAKHYQLTEPIGQSNNFVVFQKFFSDLPNSRTANSRNTVKYCTSSPFSTNNSAVPRHQLRQNSTVGLLEQRKTPISVVPLKSTYASPEQIISTDQSHERRDRDVNVAPVNVSVKINASGLDPPLLPRGDGTRQNQWYLNQLRTGTTSSTPESNDNHLSQFTIDQRNKPKNDQSGNVVIVKEILPKVINTNQYDRNSSLLSGNHRPHYEDLKQLIPFNRAFHSKPTDYNYSLGLARHYAHNRIW